MSDLTQIEEHQEVIGSDGAHVGTVDHAQDGQIKLTRTDSDDGKHHIIPSDWVERVDDHVHLNVTSAEAKQRWTEA